MNFRLAFTLFLAFGLQGQTADPVVKIRTNLGDIDVTLLPGSAPRTVTNFLNYVTSGAYNGTFFHRSVANFIIQGGGYKLVSNAPAKIPAGAAVANEYSLSNLRGTIAMAKAPGDPNSATNEWFFNLGDNSQNLNNQNGGFTVFGRVANPESLAVMDRIASVPVITQGDLEGWPVINYSSGTVTEQNLVLVNSVALTDAPSAPAVRENGIITASGFGGFTTASPGSYIEIYGTGLAGTTREWGARDFIGGNAPRALDGVSVTVNGQAAYVYYVSEGQVNVQLPGNVPTGAPASVVVNYRGQTSPPTMLNMKALAPGLLAPPSFNVGGRQYAGAIHADTRAYVTREAPAVAGETLTLYASGMGPVTPVSIPIAGRIAEGLTAVTASVMIDIAGSPVQTLYAGLVPGLVGVYQFNIVVPAGAPSGDQPLGVIVNGEAILQKLFLPVR